MKEKLVDILTKTFREWELFSIRKEKRPIQFASGACTMIKESVTEGFAIRVIDKGKIGFFASTSLHNIPEIIEQLKTNLVFGKEGAFEFTDNYTADNRIQTYDPAIENLSNEKIIFQGQEVVNKIAEYNSDIDINVYLEAETNDIHLLNSRGLNLSEKKSLYSCVIEGTLSDQGEIINVYKGGASGAYDLAIMEIAREIIFVFEYSKKKVRLDRNNTKVPIIFHPDAIDVLFLPIFHAFNGHNMYLGTSPLLGKEGLQEFSTHLTITESPQTHHATFSRNFDDEGIAIREKYLVKNGRINEFLYDLNTAHNMNTTVTGNGFRSNASSPNMFMEPTINATGLSVKEGTIKNDDIIKNTKRGIIIYSLLGVGQGNIINGNFSNNIQIGFYIENGEIVGRVKDIMIAGNSFECFKNIDCIGNKRFHEKETLSTPYMQFSNINVVC